MKRSRGIGARFAGLFIDVISANFPAPGEARSASRSYLNEAAGARREVGLLTEGALRTEPSENDGQKRHGGNKTRHHAHAHENGQVAVENEMG